MEKKSSYYPGKERRNKWLENLVNDFDNDVGDGRWADTMNLLLIYFTFFRYCSYGSSWGIRC
jgi:hypothetical protein